MDKLILKDSYGRELKEGQRVAYNLSGEVAFGTIKSFWVKEIPQKYWHPYFRYNIKIDAVGGGTSTVTNPRNLVILEDLDAVFSNS